MTSKYTIDILSELFNIGVAKGAAALASMMNSKIQLYIPEIEVVEIKDINNYFAAQKNIKAIILDFKNPTNGKAIFHMSKENTDLLVRALANTEEVKNDPNDLLREIGNIVLNGIIASVSQFISLSYIQKVPDVYEGDYQGLTQTFNDYKVNSFLIICKTRFEINYHSGIEGEILVFSDSILKYAEKISAEKRES